MIPTLVNWIFAALTLVIADSLLSGVSIASFTTALLAAVVLGVVNAVVKPILILLTLPVNLLTLGLFTFVINGLMVLIAASVVPGFTVDGLGWAIALTVTLWALNTVVQAVFQLRPQAAA